MSLDTKTFEYQVTDNGSGIEVTHKVQGFTSDEVYTILKAGLAFHEKVMDHPIKYEVRAFKTDKP